MRPAAWILLALCMLHAVAAEARSSSAAGDIERRVRALQAEVDATPHRSFVRRFPNGRTQEMHTWSAGGDSYVRYNAQDLKIVEWTRRPEGVLQYESWYSAQHVRERLAVDARTITYQSYYASGKKWQEYRADRKTRARTVNVYDSSGVLTK